jgi:hypothetical protein
MSDTTSHAHKNPEYNYQLVNKKTEDPSFTVRFMLEIFKKFSPESRFGSIYYNEIEEYTDAEISNLKPFFGDYFFVESRYKDEEQYDLETDSKVTLYNVITKKVYELYRNQPIEMFSDIELIDWIMHRKDYLILDKNNNFLPYFYTTLNKNLNVLEFNSLFESPINAIFSDIASYVRTYKMKFIVMTDSGYIYRTTENNDYLVYTNLEDSKNYIAKFKYTDETWRDEDIITSIIYTDIYFTELDSSSQKFKLIKYNKELLTEWEPHETFNVFKTKLPMDIIIPELVSIALQNTSIDKSKLNTFTCMLLQKIPYKKLKEVYEKKYM